MDTFDTIKKRQSIRRFLPEPIPRGDLEGLIEAARLAPSAHNTQPWEFVIVRKEETKEQLAAVAENGAFMANAPAVIVVCCRRTDHALEDGCAAVENMLLAATSKGIGSCWIAGAGKPYAEEVKQIIKTPGHQQLIALIALGYAAEQPTLRPSKRLLDDLLHWETF